MSTKRLRHPGGTSWLVRQRNEVGEWSLYVAPENLIIDTFHRGLPAHVHDPTDLARRIPLGDLQEAECVHRVILHLMHNGRIELGDLVKELQCP